MTDRAFGVVGRRSPLAALFRNRVVARRPRHPLVIKTRLGSRIGGYLGQYRIRYRYVDNPKQSPEWAQDPAVGLRLPPVDKNQQALNTMTWQLHSYGAGEVTRPDIPAWIEGPHGFRSDSHGRLRSDRLYLVRPDEFVAASIPLRGNGLVDASQSRSALAAHWIVME